MKANVKAYLKFRYEKIRPLKQSDKGEVWLAVNKSTNQPVILKQINYAGLPYAALKENPHALLAKIFYCAESETDTVIVEEFLSGETLSGKKLTESQTRAILLQICEGLKFLHELGIIHRDIKPSNLILQSGGQIRLIDFDAARTVKENQAADTKLLGTKGYAPPEQFGFGQTDARSDIYSLGKTFLELTENPGSLKKILLKCVEVDPKNRYQNISELQAALSKKNFPFIKICASFAAVLTGVFLFFNSTDGKNFPAETQTAAENLQAEIPAETEIPPIETEKNSEIPTDNLPTETPAEVETENLQAEVEVEKLAPRSNLELLQPLPAENFQPSFPAAPTFNPIWGGVKLGDSLETARAILGDEEEIVRYDGFNFVNHFFKDLNLTIENDRVTVISSKSSSVETALGIRQGDSIEKVFERYGDNFTTRQFGEMTVYIYAFQSFSAELRFAVEHNLVTAITLMSVE